MTATRFEITEDGLFNPDSEALQRPEMLLYYSSDQGHTWSELHIVSIDLPPDRYTCNSAGSLTQFTPDRWMYPLETWKPEGYEGPPDQKAAAVFSADQGQTWGEFLPSPTTKAATSCGGSDEPSCPTAAPTFYCGLILRHLRRSRQPLDSLT